MNKSRMQRLAGLLVEARAEDRGEDIEDLRLDINTTFDHLNSGLNADGLGPIDLVLRNILDVLDARQNVEKLSAEDIERLEVEIEDAELLVSDFIEELQAILERARALAL